MSFNQSNLIGNLTADPDLRYLSDGTPVAGFNLAVNSKYGQKEEVLFMPITVFGKVAESCCQYLKKGSQALASGRLVEEKWEKDGVQHRKIKLIAQTVRFLGGKRDGEAPHETTDLEPF